MATTTDDTQDVDQLRYRVSLYIQVILLIDLYAWITDVVTPLLFEGLETPTLTPRGALLRIVVTLILGSGWAFTRFGRPGRLTVIALESAFTLGMAFIYVHLSMAYFRDVPGEMGGVFGMMGIMLLLIVRAPLVPSPVWRSLFVGAASVSWIYVVAGASLRGLPAVVVDGLTFVGMVFVAATGVISHVIYGLRRQVRDAMRLGQYQLGRKLGEGGMGVVYEATHLMLRRPTAVKLLPVEKAGAQTVARFEREVQQTSRLEHPNSVSIYDYGRTPDGQFYYAMELVDGMTLQQLVDGHGPVSSARAVSILTQATRALAEAHSRGLVHRDIKPANIMLCERAGVADTVKVLDFGLVKALDDPEIDRQLTQANTVVGTPHYLAPEAISSAEDVSPPVDVYALGAIGFFLLTGRDVFPGDSVIEVCSQHLKTSPESPSAVLGAPVDPELEALVLHCLAKDPGERPRDGTALARELEALSTERWTPEEARAWWGDHRETQEAELESRSTPTRLAVDVGGRQ